MEEASILALIALLGVADILLLNGKAFRAAAARFSEEIVSLRDEIDRGGGPGSPSHPIPANDSVTLNRRSPKVVADRAVR